MENMDADAVLSFPCVSGVQGNPGSEDVGPFTRQPRARVTEGILWNSPATAPCRTMPRSPLVACNAENDSGVSYRNEAGRPPPNLPLVRGRDFQRYRFHCYRPLAGCGKTNFLMKSLSAPCDKTGFFPLVLPLWGRLQRGQAGCGRPFSAAC